MIKKKKENSAVAENMTQPSKSQLIITMHGFHQNVILYIIQSYVSIILSHQTFGS